MRYQLLYDYALVEWTGYYRSYFRAWLAVQWNVYIASWGGKAYIKDAHPEYARDPEEYY